MKLVIRLLILLKAHTHPLRQFSFLSNLQDLLSSIVLNPLKNAVTSLVSTGSNNAS